MPHDLTDQISGHVLKVNGVTINPNQRYYQENIGKTLEVNIRAACVTAFCIGDSRYMFPDPIPDLGHRHGLLHAVRKTLPPSLRMCDLDCREVAKDLREEMLKLRAASGAASGESKQDGSLSHTLQAGVAPPDIIDLDKANSPPAAAPAASEKPPPPPPPPPAPAPAPAAPAAAAAPNMVDMSGMVQLMQMQLMTRLMDSMQPPAAAPAPAPAAAAAAAPPPRDPEYEEFLRWRRHRQRHGWAARRMATPDSEPFSYSDDDDFQPPTQR